MYIHNLKIVMRSVFAKILYWQRAWPKGLGGGGPDWACKAFPVLSPSPLLACSTGTGEGDRLHQPVLMKCQQLAESKAECDLNIILQLCFVIYEWTLFLWKDVLLVMLDRLTIKIAMQPGPWVLILILTLDEFLWAYVLLYAKSGSW